MTIMGIVFTKPLYLIGLVLLPLVIYLLKKKINYGKYTNVIEDIKKVYKYGFIRRNFKIIIISLLYVGFILLAADPNITDQKETIKRNGIDIVLALDVSFSMNADDMNPSRIEAAKNVLSGFISNLKTDRAGLVVFAGKPFTSCPLTFDYSILQDITKNLSTDTIDQSSIYMQGTAIGDGLLNAINLFKESKDRERVIVLLTDGTANMGVDPIVSAKLAKEKGIKIYTIGLGSSSGASIQLKGPFGNIYRQSVEGVDDTTLTNIAQIGNGKYFKAQDNFSLKKVFEELEKLQKKDLEIVVNTEYRQYYYPFVVGIMILFISYLLYLLYFDQSL